jgi:hypothetical protein
MAVEELVEVRCPVDLRFPDGTCRPGRLFLKVVKAGQAPQVVQPDNLMELECADCRKRLARDHGVRVRRVLHRFDLAGNLIETLTER